MEQYGHFIKIAPEQAQRFVPLCGEHSLNAALAAGQRGVAAGLVDDTGEPLAAITGLMEENALWITGLTVMPEKRRQGLGTRLVKGALGLAIRAGLAGIYLEYAMPQYRELEAFLKSCGFDTELEDNRSYRCTIETMRNALAQTQLTIPQGISLMRVGELPQELRTQWYIRLGKEYPGQLVPKACMACLRGHKLVGHTVCKSGSDGKEVTLNKLALAPDHLGVAMLLLQATMAGLCGSGAERFSYAAGTAAECRMIEYLGQQFGLTWEVETTHIATLFQGEQEPSTGLDPVDVVMPRLNGLQELLDGLGIETRMLVVDFNQLPYLELVESPYPMQLKYIPVDDQGERQYVLLATAQIPVDPEQPVRELWGHCELFNDISIGPTVSYDSEQEQLQFRAAMPEVGRLVDREVLALFLELFREGVDRLRPGYEWNEQQELNWN